MNGEVVAQPPKSTKKIEDWMLWIWGFSKIEQRVPLARKHLD